MRLRRRFGLYGAFSIVSTVIVAGFVIAANVMAVILAMLSRR
ncbi:MAG: hypothetical protein WC858_06115 [Parcubacteria group bacterium]|jgi:hypothetical protein